MIGKPISQATRIALGIISFLVLIGLYTLISHRAYQKNPNQKSVPGWVRGDRSFLLGFKKAATPLPTLGRGQTDEGDSFVEFSTRDAGWIYQDAIWDGNVSLLYGGPSGVTLDTNGVPSSLLRFILGIVVGSFLAVVVGIAMGCYPWIEACLKPPVSFLASIPPTAMMVVYMLLFGLEMKMFVAVVGIGIFPTLAYSIYQAVKNDVPESAIYKSYTLGASKLEIIWEVVIPQILPRIIDAIRLQVGPAMIFLIAVELGLGSEGIGYRLRNARRGNYYNVIFIYLIMLGIFGMVVDWLLSRFRRWMCPWFGEASA